jgi:26S proteasome regulatory subunit N9
MAVSVLISKKIYNFSELLEQPVLKSLEGSPQGWSYELLCIFNRGNV